MRHSYRHKSRAIVVIDGNTFNVVHVYVHCSMRDAARQFLQSVSRDLDPAYSDMRDEAKDMLDRYQFIETSQVTIGRR